MALPYPPPAKGTLGSSARIGRPPQWTSSRSRKLARLYMYTTLSVDKILKVLEEDVFKPRKNSAQKTIHNMLDHDPRYLRPESREDMNLRIQWLSSSPNRQHRKQQAKSPPSYEEAMMDVKEAVLRDPSLHELNDAEVTTCFENWKGFYAPTTEGPMPDAFDARDLSPRRMQLTEEPGPSDPEPRGISQPGFPQLALKSPTRRSTIQSTSTDASTQTIQDLKNRLSGCSTHYANQVSNLLRKFTIGSESDLTRIARRDSMASTEGLGAPDPATFDGSFALPGDLINAHRYKHACLHGPMHDLGHCWCAIAERLAEIDDFWISRDGELSTQAQGILQEPSGTNISLRDRFGNTPLHLFAACDGYQMQLVALVLNCDDLAAINTAGQTFLHALAPSWFSALHDQYAALLQLLAHLRTRQPDLVYVRDVYGRTFFHRLHSLVNDPEILAGIVQHYDRVALSRRDAFDDRPLVLPGPLSSPRRAGTLSPLEEEGSPSSSFPNEDAFIRYHESLLRIITASDNNPSVEDSDGKNGLHCLAEAIVDQKMMDERRNALSTGRTFKRKFDKKEKPEGDGGTPQLATRLRLIQGLLSPPSVDINHYDSQGNTVLMAFVTHLSDDQEDKLKNLSTILETLIASGAQIEGRNRRGETAFLVAARLGRKIALTTLLEHGANVHARDANGHGVLDIIDEHCRGAKNDITLYGRLEACRVILTSKKQEHLGVKQSPTIVDEWTVCRPAGEPMDMSV